MNVQKYTLIEDALNVFRGVSGPFCVVPKVHNDGKLDNFVYVKSGEIISTRIQKGAALVHFLHGDGEESTLVFHEGTPERICSFFRIQEQSNLQDVSDAINEYYEDRANADDDIEQVWIYEVEVL